MDEKWKRRQSADSREDDEGVREHVGGSGIRESTVLGGVVDEERSNGNLSTDTRKTNQSKSDRLTSNFRVFLVEERGYLLHELANSTQDRSELLVERLGELRVGKFTSSLGNSVLLDLKLLFRDLGKLGDHEENGDKDTETGCEGEAKQNVKCESRVCV